MRLTKSVNSFAETINLYKCVSKLPEMVNKAYIQALTLIDVINSYSEEDGVVYMCQTQKATQMSQSVVSLNDYKITPEMKVFFSASKYSISPGHVYRDMAVRGQGQVVNVSIITPEQWMDFWTAVYMAFKKTPNFTETVLDVRKAASIVDHLNSIEVNGKVGPNCKGMPVELKPDVAEALVKTDLVMVEDVNDYCKRLFREFALTLRD